MSQNLDSIDRMCRENCHFLFQIVLGLLGMKLNTAPTVSDGTAALSVLKVMRKFHPSMYNIQMNKSLDELTSKNIHNYQ